LGAAQAADDKRSRDVPGFNELDKNDDGALSRTEAGGNRVLLARFNEVDATASSAASNTGGSHRSGRQVGEQRRHPALGLPPTDLRKA
jgi:hypothetical protein